VGQPAAGSAANCNGKFTVRSEAYLDKTKPRAGGPRHDQGFRHEPQLAGRLTTVAAKWLSHGILDQHALSRLAGAGPVQEPTMTGALAKARETTLDPCIPPKRS
jgi:hypothetical protein